MIVQVEKKDLYQVCIRSRTGFLGRHFQASEGANGGGIEAICTCLPLPIRKSKPRQFLSFRWLEMTMRTSAIASFSLTKIRVIVHQEPKPPRFPCWLAAVEAVSRVRAWLWLYNRASSRDSLDVRRVRHARRIRTTDIHLRELIRYQRTLRLRNRPFGRSR